MNYIPNEMDKQNLIDIIQSLPDTMLIDVSRSVPEPDGVEYLMGYKGIRTSIVSSATNCKMNISIEYMEKLKPKTKEKKKMKLTKEDYLNSIKSWVKYSPWEWIRNYCDEQGRCWFQQYGKWILITPETAYNTVTCLPFHITPN